MMICKAIGLMGFSVFASEGVSIRNSPKVVFFFIVNGRGVVLDILTLMVFCSRQLIWNERLMFYVALCIPNPNPNPNPKTLVCLFGFAYHQSIFPFYFL